MSFIKYTLDYNIINIDNKFLKVSDISSFEKEKYNEIVIYKHKIFFRFIFLDKNIKNIIFMVNNKFNNRFRKKRILDIIYNVLKDDYSDKFIMSMRFIVSENCVNIFIK